MSDIAILYANKKDAQLAVTIAKQNGLDPDVLPMHTPAHALAVYDAIVLMGDQKSVFDVKSAKCEPAAFKLGSPVLAMGNTAHLMNVALGGKVARNDQRQKNQNYSMTLKQSQIFHGLGREEKTDVPLTDLCTEVAPNCQAIGHVEGQIGAFHHSKEKLYGIQTPPSEEKQFAQVLTNFLRIADIIKQETAATDVLKHARANNRPDMQNAIVKIATKNELRAALLPCLTRHSGSIAVISGKGHYPSLQQTAVQMLTSANVERVLYVFENDLGHPEKSSFSAQTLKSLHAHANLTVQVLLDSTSKTDIECALIVLPITTKGKPAVVLRPTVEKKGKKYPASFADCSISLLKEIVQRMKQRGFGAVLYDLTPISSSSAEW